jgi:acrylyl-CoA reductase (NADPH)
MTERWRGLRVSYDRDGADAPARVELATDFTDEVLTDGDVWIDVDHSSINFKDGLAITGRRRIVRPSSLIPGIDLVGTVTASDSDAWSPGDRVLINGCGIGETHHGGLAERARVPAAFLVPVPDSMTQTRAAAVGTAGYTAMLAVLALERAGALDRVVVTGAVGGVGSIAISLLAGLGSHVTAVTGREREHEYLRGLGASEILPRSEFTEPGAPLQKARFTGAIDTVGGTILANVVSRLSYGGIAAACGNAASNETTMSVLPFLLRAVTLAGINSVETPQPLRYLAWSRLGSDLDLGVLDELTETVPLGGAVAAGERILGGGVRGRIVVDVRA